MTITLRVRASSQITAVLACLSLLPAAASAEGAGSVAATSMSDLRPFLETGLFVGGQTDDLIWAQGNARAEAGLLYVEGGLDIQWMQPEDRPGHRAGIAVSVDMGGESGWRPALGLGPRVTYYLGRNWALQAQVGFLGRREGETEASNELGSECYYFKTGYQLRVGLLHRRGMSVVALSRVLDYDAELYSDAHPWPPLRRSGTAHLFCLGVMVHGKTGAYASLGSFLLMGILTGIGVMGEMGD